MKPTDKKSVGFIYPLGEDQRAFEINKKLIVLAELRRWKWIRGYEIVSVLEKWSDGGLVLDRGFSGC